MGTSKSYPGPSGRNPLIPPGADEGGGLPDVGSPPTEPALPVVPGTPVQPTADRDAVPSPAAQPAIPWSVPKAALTRAANGRGAGVGGGVGRALRDHVRAHGGPRQAVRRAQSGRESTASVAGFLGHVARSGFVEAARAIGLGHVIGRDATAVLSEVVDHLAPAGALLEEAAARRAVIDTFSELAREYDVRAAGVEALDRLDAAGVAAAVLRMVANYITERFKQLLVSRVERSSASLPAAERLLREVKSLIRAAVAYDFRGVDVVALDWRDTTGRAMVERIFTDAYNQLETLEAE